MLTYCGHRFTIYVIIMLYTSNSHNAVDVNYMSIKLRGESISHAHIVKLQEKLSALKFKEASGYTLCLVAHRCQEDTVPFGRWKLLLCGLPRLHLHV